IEFFLPAFGLGDPAGRAESGFTGEEHPFLIPAFWALILKKPHCLGTAGEHLADVFSNCRAFEKFTVFFRDVLPVIGKDAFYLFPFDDLHRQVGEVLSLSQNRKSSTADRLIAGIRWRQPMSHINGFTMYT